MIVKQLSVFLENRPDVLTRLCDALGSQGVNIRGLSVSDSVDHAVVRLVVDDSARAIHVLGEYGALVVENDVLAVRLSNEPHAFADVAQRLGGEGIEIEYAYGSGNGSEGTIFFRVTDPERADRLLDQRA